MWENNVKEIMYRVLHAKTIYMYIMGIDFFRLAISRNKCLENDAMHTRQINGRKKLSEHCRQRQLTLR